MNEEGQVWLMARRKRTPNLIAFIAIGAALVAVGVSTDSNGLLVAGVLFVVMGAASVVKDKRERKANNSDDQQQQD